MNKKETDAKEAKRDVVEKEVIEIDVSQPGRRIVRALEKGRVVGEYILKISKKRRLTLL